jgi:hypothetical protein
MAVIVRKNVTIAGSEVEMKTYLPSGGLSKEERLRAERLEEVLAELMPRIAEKISNIARENRGLVYRRYMLGRYLREIIDNPELVSRGDVENKMVFLAIWDHLPESLKPEGPHSAKAYSETQHRRKGFLSLCYEISGFDWQMVKWIKRWDDWYRLAFRPGIVRDKRIMKLLGEAIAELETCPSAKDFRQIAVLLGRAFPTRRLKDSSFLTEGEIAEIVRRALAAVCGRSKQKCVTGRRTGWIPTRRDLDTSS